MYAAFLILAMCLGADQNGHGVIVPSNGFAEALVTRTGPHFESQPGSDIYHGLIGSGVPPGDAAKWHITIFANSREHSSQQLIQSFQTDPHLQQIAAWGHFNVIDVQRLSQAARVRAYAADSANLPLFVVYPPKDSTAYPFQYVVRLSGSRLSAMPPRELAIHVVDQVRAFTTRVTGQDCPGPWCPNPNPNQPQQPSPYPPQPQPQPQPNVMPPLPIIPDISPAPHTPATPATPTDSQPMIVEVGVQTGRLLFLLILFLCFGVVCAAALLVYSDGRFLPLTPRPTKTKRGES